MTRIIDHRTVIGRQDLTLAYSAAAKIVSDRNAKASCDYIGRPDCLTKRQNAYRDCKSRRGL
ncbi:hypothetical protein OICFNHDK_1527 [Methylobacterium bullatum]|uniref:Uncharacterized protein n=1 Tax=Methylobacterium bullatum TaxID=570505 RepID=A0AAV4Z6B8_9HYPH|nr:hypothetical protein OICFNHDK_1527 [Methylobacterium bullatum]